MSWVYCKCGQGLSYPTDKEVLLDEYFCPSCGSSVDPQVSKAEVLARLLDRVKTLEAKLNLEGQ